MTKIIILNNKKCQIVSDDEKILKKVHNHLAYKNIGIEYTAAYQNGWSGITYLLGKTGKFNYGLLTKVKSFLEKNDISYFIEDLRPPKPVIPELDISENLKKYNLIPREHQIRICETALKYDRGIIRAATGSGKCSSIDSLHITEYGLLDYSELENSLKIKLKEQEAIPLEINVATPLNKNNIDKSSLLYYDGYGRSKKITTKYGFTLTATPEHKIQILNENGEINWKNFSNLKENDYCIISFGNQIFGSKQISLDDAYWYGLLIGDGSLTSKSQIKLTNKDNHILDFAERYIKKNNIKYAKKVKSKNKAFDIIINNSHYRSKLKEFGFEYCKSIDKTLPLNIRMLAKEPLAMVLRGIYETDGWVEMEKGKPSICLGLSNKKIIDQIHLILLNFGIVASRRVKKTTHEDSHILTIYREFIPSFMKEIGFYSRGIKYRQLRWAMIKNSLLKNNSNTNLVPYQNLKIKKLIDYYISVLSKKSLLSKCPIKYNTLRSWSGNKFWRLPSKENLKIFIQWYHLEIMKYGILPPEIDSVICSINYICYNSFYFLPITSIIETFSHNYDFTVPETHSFVSQGFINHNTLAAALMTAKLNRPTMIYVIGLDLLDQFHKLFSKLFNEPIGYIGDGVCNIERINIASIWTIGRALKLDKKNIIDDDDLVDEKEVNETNQVKILNLLKTTEVHLYDESHVITTATISEIYKNINPVYMFGFSGTPFPDSVPVLAINNILGEQIIDVSASELIKLNLLAQPLIKFYTVPKMHVSDVYTAVYKEYIVENDIRNNMISDLSKELIEKKYRPLVLFKQIRHGEILLEKMQDLGIRCAMLYGNDSLEKRGEIKEQLINKEIDLILASTIFDIGLDLPELNALILCGSGKSSIRALQRIGRVLRMTPGKKYAAVVDFYDQAKFLKKHSQIRNKIYASEDGFKIFKSKEMK